MPAVAAEGQAPLLSLNLKSLTGGGTVAVSAGEIAGLTLGTQLPIELALNREGATTLSFELPPGFALTSVSCAGGVATSIGANSISVTAQLPDVSCTLGTVDVLLGSIGTIVPLLVRQNDMLMSLDLGLGRQIDILSGGSGEGPGWQKPSGLGGSGFAFAGEGARDGLFDGSAGAGHAGAGRMGLGMGLGAGSQEQPGTFAFATSLNEMRAVSAQPYGLGANSRAAAPPPSRLDFWAEGYFAYFDESGGPQDGSGHTGVLYAGADYRVSRDLLLGALVQFDDTKEEFGGFPHDAKTTGWLAGPYATLKLPYNLYLQARAAWGSGNSEVTLVPGTPDEFDTRRWLARATLLGQWDYGHLRVQPRASVGYIEEDQESYVSALGGVTVPATTVSLGQAKAGPLISYRERLAGGMVIEPSLLVEGVWNFHQQAGGISIDDLVNAPDLRGRTEAGVMLYTAQGVALGASFTYDGIGTGDYEAIGGRAKVRVPLD